MSDDPGTTRRRLLAGMSGLAAGSAGCLGELRRLAERDSPNQLSLEILTLPEDSDIYALRLATHLAGNLERAGIQVDIVPTRHANLLRDVLINLDYQMYVWRLPGQRDPDFLRPLLHSQFAEESGWQNPFSYSNRAIDDYLEGQLEASESQRVDILEDLQYELTEENPFLPIAFETDHRLIRSDRLRTNANLSVDNPLWLLHLRPPLGTDAAEYTTQLGTTDWRLTHNLNPISVEYRGRAGVTELLYDPLAREIEGEHVPWLANGWRWTSPTSARVPTLELTLRPDLVWQNGEPLTAEDVVFTYRFLQDTSLTEDDPHVPAPRFRGRTTLLDSIEAVNDQELRIQFVPTSRDIALQLLSVPILPEHVWEELTNITDVAGIPVSDVTTDALVADNLDPIGSGPYRVLDVETDADLRLGRFEEHFLLREELDTDEHWSLDVTPIAEIVLDIRPSAGNLANSISEGALDGSLGSLGKALSDATAEGEIEHHAEETRRLFHVGCNLREPPFANHAFRSAISQLIDTRFVIDDIFQGAGRPSRTPVHGEEFVPDRLMWGASDARQFAGTPGTGEVDEEQARELFRDAGFQYAEDGSLLSR